MHEIVSDRLYSRRRILKASALIAAGGLGSLGLAACGSGTPQSATGTSGPSGATGTKLVFANWGASEASTTPIFKAFGPDFEKESGVGVELMTIPFLQYQDVVTTHLMSGDPPDVAQSYGLYTGAFADLNALADLTPYFTKSELEGIADSSSGIFNGKLQGITWAPLPNLLWWRHALVEKAGVDPASGPKTWDEFEKILRYDYGSGVAGLALTTKVEPSVYVWWLQFLWAFGGDLVTDDGEVLLDSPGSIEFGKWVQTAYTNHWLLQGADGTSGRNSFQAGNAAMTIDGSFGTSIFAPKNGKYSSVGGVGILPAGPALKKPRLTSSSHQLLVFERSQHKDDDVKFIKFLLSEKESLKYAAAAGLLPASIATLKENKGNDPMFPLTIEASKYVKNPPIGANFVQIENAFMKGMQQIWNGADPKSAFGGAADNIRAILDTK